MGRRASCPLPKKLHPAPKGLAPLCLLTFDYIPPPLAAERCSDFEVYLHLQRVARQCRRRRYCTVTGWSRKNRTAVELERVVCRWGVGVVAVGGRTNHAASTCHTSVNTVRLVNHHSHLHDARSRQHYLLQLPSTDCSIVFARWCPHTLPSNRWFLLPRKSAPFSVNGISIGLAVFAQFISVTNNPTYRQTDRQTDRQTHLPRYVKARRKSLSLLFRDKFHIASCHPLCALVLSRFASIVDRAHLVVSAYVHGDS